MTVKTLVILTLYRSEDPATRVAKFPLVPGSPYVMQNLKTN